MMSRRASLATPQTSITRATVMAVIRTQPGTSPRSPPSRASLRKMGQSSHGMGKLLRSAGELGEREQAWIEGEEDDHRQLEEHHRDQHVDLPAATGLDEVALVLFPDVGGLGPEDVAERSPALDGHHQPVDEPD